jgi:hypothetical protein
MDTESTASEPSDEELLRRLSSDPAVFEVFYRRHVDRVIGFAARRVSDPADAADLVAATFVTVLTAARSYDPGRASRGRGCWGSPPGSSSTPGAGRSVSRPPWPGSRAAA